MKFPKELSIERLSLLSPEDRKIYEYEHSALYVELNDYPVLNESDVNEEYLTEDKDDFTEETFNYYFDELYNDKEIIEELGIDEYNKCKKSIYEYIKNNKEIKELNEYGGISIDYWMKGLKLGWLGKLSAGLLTGLIGLLAWLFMKGKDRLAMKKLKLYMNKMVELVDMGVNKKKPWYSFLMVSKKARLNTGDYNKACFRTILETAERNMACLYTLCIHSLGFLNPNRSSFNDINTGFLPEKNSGLDKFHLLSQITTENIGNTKADTDLLPVKPDEKLYNNIMLPAVPTNYKFLMCDIEYPSKAKVNPNGSLFMKPSKEILLDKGADIGKAYFNNNVNLNNIITIKTESSNNNQNNNESIDVQSILSNINRLLNEAGLLTNDLDNDIIGQEIELETEQKNDTNVTEFSGNIIDAIDNYVRSSVSVVAKLIRAISGENASSKMEKFLELIMTINNASENKLTEYMKKNDAVLKDISNRSAEVDKRKLENKDKLSIKVFLLMSYLTTKDSKLNGFVNIKLCGDLDKKDKFLDEILKLVLKRNYKETLLNNLCAKYTNYKTLDKVLDILEDMSTEANESYKYNKSNKLYEYYFDEDDEIDETTSSKTIDDLKDLLLTSYNNIKNTLSLSLIVITENDPANWAIIKNSKERMNKLKEAADKEINAKIELICRTSTTAASDLGDKLKNALSKHPIRAESLKGIWAKYSDDLLDRIESRLRSITGDNANSNILDTIKQFLNTIYPNLIALLLYYKSLFYFLKIYTAKNPIIEYTDEEEQLITNTIDNDILSILMGFRDNNKEKENNETT